MATAAKPLAVVTGASSGIGYELARCCAKANFDLVIAADEPGIEHPAQELRSLGARVDAVEVDLSKTEGVDELLSTLGGRDVDALLANAGHGLGGGFLDQDFTAVRHMVDTNILGTIYLVQRVGQDMRRRRAGRILLTGSVAGYVPGTFQAVYSATKAFIDSFSVALRHEVQDSGMTVTCLMPGPTETNFFRRAGMLDTKVGQSDKADPADVAATGFKAMMDGDESVVSGWGNKIQTALSSVLPAGLTAEQHRRMAEPGSGDRS